MPANRTAFTLIELLVVMVIMAILAGMSIAALNLIKDDSKAEQTRLILAAVNNTLSLAKAETGSLPSPVEHPLAGSKEPRAAFWRSTAPYPSYTGLGLRVGDRAWLELDEQRALLGDDRYADQRVPLLYGLPRQELTILGSNLYWVTEYLRLPKPMGGAATVPDPYDTATYPNNLVSFSSDAGVADAAAVKTSIDYLFGFGSAWSELTKLGAVFAPPPTATYDGSTVTGRVWFDPGSEILDQWEHGRLSNCNGWERGGTGWNDVWTRYRLPGPAIYDAWGNEVLYRVLGNGSVQLSSAGPDGAFVWAPGENRVLETLVGAAAPAADDADGRQDNVVVGVGQ